MTWSGRRRPGLRGAASLPAHVRLRRPARRPGCASSGSSLRLDDRVAPTLRLNGLAVRARKQARPTDDRTVRRRRRRRRAAVPGPGERRAGHRATPCPAGSPAGSRSGFVPARAGPRAGFAAATASPPFRQGPNLVRVCAADYAASTAANRTCAQRRVRVDNLCPISEVSRGGQAPRPAAPRGDRAPSSPVACSTARGRGVAGRRVCVATRVRMRGAAERVASTPLTDADGALPGRDPGRPQPRGARRLLAGRRRRAGALSRASTSRSARASAAASPPDRATATGSASRSGCPGRAAAAPRADPGARRSALARPAPGPHRRPRDLPRPLPLPRHHRAPQVRASAPWCRSSAAIRTRPAGPGSKRVTVVGT